MNRNRELTIYQEILLLAFDEEKGTPIAGTMLLQALGGAVLAELAGAGAIRIAEDKKKTVTAGSGARPADPLLAECLQKVREQQKPKPASHWVMKFAGVKALKDRVAADLVEAGVLQEETGSVLKVFKRRVYPEADPRPEQELRERMHRAIFTGTSRVEPRTAIVIALARASGILEKVFPKKELKERKARLEQLCSGELAGSATAEAVQAVRAAIMVATMVPVITAASTS